MEKFQMDEEKKKLEVFSNFINRTKETFATIIANIKENIKRHEHAIEEATGEIETNEAAREKCEREIIKMENKITTIKCTIENIENTYKKMVDAYSSTSKGETKVLYSEIIDGAKSNCENEVEKNRLEIERLRSDIDAIKNNISEFTKVIEFLKKELSDYEKELKKYRLALDYYTDLELKMNSDLSDISSFRKEDVLTETSLSSNSKKIIDELLGTGEEEVVDYEQNLEADSNEEEPLVPVGEIIGSEKDLSEISAPTVNFEDSLKQIYDLTGYKPNKDVYNKLETKRPISREEKKVETSKTSEEENINSLSDVEAKTNSSAFNSHDMKEWENILNGGELENSDINSDALSLDEEPKETVTRTLGDSACETVNQLLKPYGTSFERLSSLVENKIEYKNGSSIPFELNAQDIIKVINLVDVNDLKEMKRVGPEITLLRKIKNIREGVN